MWQQRCLVLGTACIMAVSIYGCGKKDEGGTQASPTGTTQQQASREGSPQAPAQPSAPAGGTGGAAPSPSQLSDIAAKNREVLTQMNEGKTVTAVTADTLKGLLPEQLAGMSRGDASAERNQAMGMDMTIANAQYEGQNDTSINLTITDVGNMSGPMKLGMVGWTMAEYDRKTDSGYEKTGTYNGFKGMEEYDSENKQGTIRVFLANRFVVEVEGNGVTMDTLKQTLGQLDLKKIAGLATGS